MQPDAQLVDLLHRLFDPRELQLDLTGRWAQDAAQELPSPASASPKQYFDAVVQHVQRAGLLSDFFALLKDKRPRRAVEIEAVERLFVVH